MLPPVLIPMLLIYAPFFSLEFLHLSPIFEFHRCLLMRLSTLTSQHVSSAPGLIQQDFCWLFMRWAPGTQNTGPPVKSQELCTYMIGAKTEVFPNLSNSSRIRCSNSSNTSTSTHHNAYILQSNKSYYYLHAVHGWYSESHLGHQHLETAWQGTWVHLAHAQKVSSRMCFHKP